MIHDHPHGSIHDLHAIAVSRRRMLRLLGGAALVRAIDNLLENAHKYTPDRTSPITLSVRAADRGVDFEVADRGIGIATADLPHIYNAFFRAERSRSRETGGVGLGLTLAKRIVEAHGGAIEITSAVGKGTRVRVRVPAVAAIDPAVDAPGHDATRR